jgi:hypothetical protein
MANIVTLHKRQVFLPDGAPAEYANLSVFESGTTTQVSVYSDSDLTIERSQPIPADANGVFPVCYVATGAALELLVTDEDFNPLPGYPMGDITPEPLGTSAADEISFTPIEGLTETTVQAAIEAVYEEATGQSDLVTARFTPFVTAGSSNAYTLTPTPTATTYAAGQSWMVRPDRTNTGAATLNVDGLGARNIMKYNTSGSLVALAAGEIQAYREFLAYDDGTQIIALLGRGFPYGGSGANGTWELNSNGKQTCRKSILTLTTSSTADHVAGVWTFPRAFANTTDLVITAQLCGETSATAGTGFANNATPDRAVINAPVVGTFTTTQAAIRVFADGTDFVNGDELYVMLTAEGNG